MSRGDLSESEWRVLKIYCRLKQSIGDAVVVRSKIVRSSTGILWRLRCGTPWRDVPPKYGNWNTIYRRFGVGAKPGSGRLFRSRSLRSWLTAAHYSIDSTTVRAHISAAGGKGDSSTRSWPLAGRVHQ
ncbi:transposase [Brucella anthropi]|uniref:transposase n=1 Tax=Brucella anthropi TaxID=529 RepID=UPI000DFF7B3A|nr:Transposase and inactivated derivatives [Brucella anthropi]